MALNIEDINTNKSTSTTTLLISVDAQGAGAGTLALITHVSCYPVGNTPTGVWYYPDDLVKLGDLSYLTSINGSLWWEFDCDEWTNNCEVYFSSGTECAAGCIMVSGADATTTVRDYAEGIDDTSPLQLADTGLTTDDMRISGMACYNTSSGAHTPADTEAWDADATSDYANSVGQYATLTGTSYTSSWTSTDPGNFVLQAVSLIPSGGGPAIDDEVIEAIPRGIARGIMRGGVC